MDNKYSGWLWQDGEVNLQKEYIELTYEEDPDSNGDDTIPLALIGRPENGA